MDKMCQDLLAWVKDNPQCYFDWRGYEAVYVTERAGWKKLRVSLEKYGYPKKIERWSDERITWEVILG
jgi:hypothetical protein